MKKILSVLIVMALLLSTVLAIVPVAAEEAAEEEKVNVLMTSRDDQMNGVGPAFYYNYPLFDHDIGVYPINAVPQEDGTTKGYQGNKTYMLRALNAANGGATSIDGRIDSGSYSESYHTFKAEGKDVIDIEGNTYHFDSYLGISLKETKKIDSFKFYTLNEKSKGGKVLIEEFALFGAVANPETHTFDENSWFLMYDLNTTVQENYTEDGELAVLEGDLFMPFEVDYIFMAFNCQGEGGGDYVVVEIEAYEYAGSDVTVDDLETAALTEAIAAAEAELAKADTYTTNSIAVLQRAYDIAKDASVNATNQQTVDYAVESLQKAILGLALLSDTTELQATIDQYASAVETDYTTSTWAVFAAARDAAVNLITSGNASESAVGEHLMALLGAGDALAVKASVETFALLQVKFNEGSALDEDLYTAKSLSALRVAMRDVNALLQDDVKDDVSQTQADEALKGYEDAFAALQKKADLDALQAILDEVLSLSNKNYTAESFAALSEAITAAQTFLSGPTANATEEEALALGAAITAAKDALVAVADFTAVDAKIAELGALVEAEYTAESWKALQDAIAAATALKDGEATQAEADEALAAITAAAEALAKPTATEPTATEQPAAQSGCGGFVGATAVVIVASLGLGAVALKRKED